MKIERRVLYNLLRMNWLRDPSVAVETWQVENYRALSLPALFEGLQALEICLDRVSFLALAENVDTPEDLTDDLLADLHIEAQRQDQIYLLIFELWRRLVPEKQSLSIFCDELDHQIDLYDREQIDDPQSIQDTLSSFEIILDENTDEGGDPRQVFDTITQGCAHDVESFLYDLIADLIDNKNEAYAQELLEGFSPYIKEEKWFNLLKARLQIFSDLDQASFLMKDIQQEILNNPPDLEFNFEVLAALVQGGKSDLFYFVVSRSLPLLQSEEEFQDLLVLCADYFHFLDKDHAELEVLNIKKSRSGVLLDRPLSNYKNDSKKLLNLFS